MMSFFTYGMIEFFSTIELITDNHIRLVLPIILDGLKSSVKDFKAGMMMLIMVISKRTIFESHLTLNLIDNLCQSCTDHESLNQTLVNVGQLVQTQHCTELSYRAIHGLTKKKSFEKWFTAFMSEYDCDEMVSCICKGLINQLMVWGT